MQQAILRYFPDTQATYKFFHRDSGRYFSARCVERFQEAVKCLSCSLVNHRVLAFITYFAPGYIGFSEITLAAEELKWLKSTCPYFTDDYLEYLAGYRFKPEQVKITLHPVSEEVNHGNIEIEATGPWVETIFWEVPLMACLSEIFFRTDLTDWSDASLFGRCIASS
jgi:nicotinate phosphoribosyltransferase